MKRVKAACLMQTLRFQIKPELSREEGERLVRDEVERYQRQLERRGVKYVIDEMIAEPDGSATLRLRKQYINNPVGNYLD